MRSASEAGKKISIIVPETRPALQGARLTAYELKADGFQVTLIPDTAVGHVMAKGMINKVVVGADRIVKSGHIFNKIGTYQIAILAKKHEIPFYPAAPISSFDFKNEWADVIIEERDVEEVTGVGGRRTAPVGIDVFNPAFDVTPPDLVRSIITDKGVLNHPLQSSIRSLFEHLID